MRIVTKIQKMSSDKSEIERQAKYDIISVNAMQKFSELAKEGHYREAQLNAYAWKNFMHNSINKNNNNNFINMFEKNIAFLNNNIQKNIEKERVINQNQRVSKNDLVLKRLNERKDDDFNNLYKVQNFVRNNFNQNNNNNINK